MHPGSAAVEDGRTLTTFATWMFTLHVSGVRANDDAAADACDAVLRSNDEPAGAAAVERLVARVRALLAEGDLVSVATRLYGTRVRSDLGAGDRETRTARIRRYQFSARLPWLARIWERTGQDVRPGWLVVERVTDEVTSADPNPWNDVDEARRLPVQDFLVLWELDGCSNVYLAV